MQTTCECAGGMCQQIEFDEAEWYGQSVTIAAGVARKSKGKSQVHMRPLEWRAPLLPTLGDEPAAESGGGDAAS